MQDEFSSGEPQENLGSTHIKAIQGEKNRLKIVHFMKKKLDAEHSPYFFQVIIEKN